MSTDNRKDVYINVNPIITKKDEPPILTNIVSKKQLEENRKKQQRIEEQNLGIADLDLFME